MVIRKISLYIQNKALFIFISMLMLGDSALAAEIVKNVKFDCKTAEVSYVLRQPALVRISLGVEEGPMFATLVDWRIRKKGLHKEKWRKTGITGIDNMLCTQKTVFTFNYFTYGAMQPGFNINNLLEEEALMGPIGRSSSSVDLNRLHKNHKREFCHEPKIGIRLLGEIARTKDGIALVTKPVFLSVEISPKDKRWFTRERYSLYIFIDTVFVHGALEGFSPYHWKLDPKGLNKGLHLITVNLRGFNDHLGIAALPIYVDS